MRFRGYSAETYTNFGLYCPYICGNMDQKGKFCLYFHRFPKSLIFPYTTVMGCIFIKNNDLNLKFRYRLIIFKHQIDERTSHLYQNWGSELNDKGEKGFCRNMDKMPFWSIFQREFTFEQFWFKFDVFWSIRWLNIIKLYLHFMYMSRFWRKDFPFWHKMVLQQLGMKLWTKCPTPSSNFVSIGDVFKSKTAAKATRNSHYCTCLGHLGQRDTDRKITIGQGK